MPEPLPHEEETLEVVRNDQCRRLHDLVRAGFRLKELDLVAWDEIDETARVP